MIKNTQWTREAWQEKEIKRLENGDVQKFIITVSHYQGRWKARWEMITDEYRDGYKSRLSTPMAEYNGQTTIKEGRFSLNKLERAEKLLGENVDRYYDLWTQEKYQELCNQLHEDLTIIK